MIGTLLGDRYEILEKVGGGGMALVYKARCRLLNRYVAVKILRDEFNNDEEFIKNFRKESQAAASLSHPNIVNIYDVGVDIKGNHNIHYIVMEYIKGKTLKEFIREKGKLTVDETLDFSIQISEALEHAHKNRIVHRDIKPHNIMITEDRRVKVADFGIAKAATSSTVTNTSNVIGSVHYFSPEQARGGYTDEKSDIYSLGIVMYEMITGRVPYEGDSPISVALKHIQEEIIPPREIDETVPVGLQNIIMKCVKKSQVDRYGNVHEILKDLRRIKYSTEEDIIEDTKFIESPTQIIPIVEDEDVDNMKKKKRKKSRKNPDDGGFKIVFLAILLAFLVTGSMALGFFRLKNLFITPEIPVPNLVGMNVELAESEVKALGLDLKVVKEIHDKEFKKGDIISQKPNADEKVKKGYPIEVTVSKGKNYVKVPSLLNKNIMEIGEILDKANLEEGLVDFKDSDTVEANFIISQDPSPYTEVEEGTKINIIASKGPEKKTTIVPRLLGMNEKDAKKVLKSYQLDIGDRGQQPSNEYPKGTVVWQSLEPGTEVEPNTLVDLYFSSGPEEKPKEDDKKEKEVPFNINITIPQNDAETRIRVDRIQDNIIETVYDKTHDSDQVNIKVPLKGKLDAQFSLYFDDVLIETINHPDR